MEFELKQPMYVITLYAAGAVARAFLRCTTTLTLTLTVSFFQFCSHWINERILIAIILLKVIQYLERLFQILLPF